jgi:hypothetical protein
MDAAMIFGTLNPGVSESYFERYQANIQPKDQLDTKTYSQVYRAH